MKKERILIVDDEEDLRKLISLYFTLEGYGVLTASDGQQALELLDKEMPDLIVSDILMPNCNGFCLMQEMNKRLKNPPPVIFISAHLGDIDLSQLSQYPNFLKFFWKPFKLQALVAEINNYFCTKDSTTN